MAAAAAPGCLAAVLGEVWASPLPLGERRRLAARVAMAALHSSNGDGGMGGGGGGCSKCEAPTTICHMEEALREVAALDGKKDKIGVSAAKAAFRRRGEGGADVARRLSRLSKARNTAAHPDVCLLDDIRALSSVESEPDPETAVQVQDQQKDMDMGGTGNTAISQCRLRTKAAGNLSHEPLSDDIKMLRAMVPRVIEQVIRCGRHRDVVDGFGPAALDFMGKLNGLELG